MATFTIDLLTGKVFLFSGNFNGSGSTPTTGSTYEQVNYYGDLPLPASAYAGEVYLVLFGSGSYVLNRKDAGLYFSNGVTWVAMPSVPSYFSSGNFQVYDSAVNTKGIQFVTSGITSGFKKLKIQNGDGTIAYLSDLNLKVDTSVFNTYTGTTAPATFLTKTAFNTYSGTTVPANYYNKTQINTYTGATLILIGNKLNTSVFNTFTGTTLPANYYNKSQINAYTGATNTVLNNKLNKTTFSTYTGITAPGQFASKSFLSTYTGTTAPNTFASKANAVTGATNLGSGSGIYTSVSGNKIQLKSIKGLGNISISSDGTSISISGSSTGTANWNTLVGRPAWLTGTTLQAFQTGHTHSYNNLTDKLTAGVGISIISNVISATGGGGSGTTTLQLLDTVGGYQVNNIAALPIVWTQEFTGSSLSFTGGSRIYVQATGVYEISYVLNVINDTSSVKNIGTVIRKNGISDITPLSTSSFNYDLSNNSSVNVMPPYLVIIASGSYVELVAFRIGTAGDAFTKTNGSWLKIKRIS